jgi:hypothetical protein
MVETAEVRYTATPSANDDGEPGWGSAVERGRMTSSPTWSGQAFQQIDSERGRHRGRASIELRAVHRSGAALTRSLFRHDINTVEWKLDRRVCRTPSDVDPKPLDRVPIRHPFNACSTMTVAITSARTDGPPLPDGNKSPNIVSLV